MSDDAKERERFEAFAKVAFSYRKVEWLAGWPFGFGDEGSGICDRLSGEWRAWLARAALAAQPAAERGPEYRLRPLCEMCASPGVVFGRYSGNSNDEWACADCSRMGNFVERSQGPEGGGDGA
jgi:hypothetical protein